MHGSRKYGGLGWGSKILLGAVGCLILVAIALAIYGGTVTPVQHAVDKVVPDSRFAR